MGGGGACEMGIHDWDLKVPVFAWGPSGSVLRCNMVLWKAILFYVCYSGGVLEGEGGGRAGVDLGRGVGQVGGGGTHPQMCNR
jgi:hypothetical protein